MIRCAGIFTFALMSIARADNIACDNLYAMVCAPGAFDDGTGVVANPTENFDKPKQITTEVYKRSQEKIHADLKNPENVYMRKLVLAGTFANANPACEGAETAPSEKCLDIMADAANSFLIKNLQPTIGYGYVGNGFSNFQGFQGGAGSPSLSDKDYLTSSNIFLGWKDQLLEDIKTKNGFDQVEKRVRDKVFPSVKALIIAKVDKLVSDPTVKQQLIDKIRAIRYAGSDCQSLTGGGPNNINTIFIANAYYNPMANDFHYCSGMETQGSSEFRIVQTIAHEISHAIDPCGAVTGPSAYTLQYKASRNQRELDSQFPLANVVKCLRSEKSVAARKVNVPFYGGVGGGGLGTGNMGNGEAAPMPTGYSGSGMPPQCMGDQITEAFADWMSYEVLPEYIDKNFPQLTAQQRRSGYSNVFRGGSYFQCNAAVNFANDTHPLLEARTTKLEAVQPMIRAQMNCGPLPPDKIYCDDNYKPSSIKPLNKKIDPPNEGSEADHD